MERQKGVLFDLDGTLADTLGDLADTVNAALEALGYPPRSEEQYRQMAGNGARRLMERALGEAATPERAQALLDEFLRLYDAGCLRRTRPYDGISELLDALEAKNVRLAIVTNKPEAQAEKIAVHLFGGGRFEFICGGRPDRQAKPDPATVLEILRAWDMPPEQAVFVGDSDVDIRTAKNAGIRSAGAVWGFRGEAELRDAGADVLLKNPANLLIGY